MTLRKVSKDSFRHLVSYESSDTFSALVSYESSDTFSDDTFSGLLVYDFWP
jgi:hypothetical protein